MDCSRMARRFRLNSEIVLLVLLLLGHCTLAFQPSLANHCHHQAQAYTTRRINSANSKRLNGSSTTKHSKDGTQLALTGSDEINAAASSLWISSNDGPSLGGLFLGLGFVASIAAFVFANVVYTPEILEGAEEMRRDEREEQIAKVLQAVKVHALEGKDVGDLRLALETALGKSLEDYVQGVLEKEDEDALFTAADKELATILKQTLVQ